jgi:hypothetical protein
MAAPFEVLAAPFTIYLAATGTAFPAVDASPPGAWFKLGTAGSRNYDEDGVEFTHEQSIEKWRGLGETAPIKPFRSEEDLMIGLSLTDVSAEHYAKILNDAAVTDTAPGVGAAGHRAFPLKQGTSIAYFALLARADLSAYGDAFKMQYEVPIVYQSANPAPKYVKGEPATLEVEFTALFDATGGLGTLRIQDAAPLP